MTAIWLTSNERALLAKGGRNALHPGVTVVVLENELIVKMTAAAATFF